MGLAFASALQEIGLPQKDIPLALFAFNVGVEIGSSSSLLCALALACTRFKIPPLFERHASQLATYAIGSMAAFWFMERLAGFATEQSLTDRILTQMS